MEKSGVLFGPPRVGPEKDKKASWEISWQILAMTEEGSQVWFPKGAGRNNVMRNLVADSDSDKKTSRWILRGGRKKEK